ncbi:sulfur carrier protein ThiS [Corynebacterium sp. SA-MJD20WY100]|uniref:sulfur carrier protein ThiS n=1 Tax=Corynebacterium sp. SA-MJD20WY100 TaxID=3142969 RepID=UPI003221B3B6
MHITLNGSPHETNATTLAELITELGAPEDGTAAAINARVVPKSGWHTALEPGATVDLLTAVQGG